MLLSAFVRARPPPGGYERYVHSGGRPRGRGREGLQQGYKEDRYRRIDTCECVSSDPELCVLAGLLMCL